LDEANRTDDETELLVTGDAPTASAAIEAWMGGRLSQPDWEGVLGQMRDALATLTSIPLVATDPVAQAILGHLASAQDMEELSADIDRLGARVNELLAARATRAPVRSRGKRMALFGAAEPAPAPRKDEVLEELELTGTSGRRLFRL
jgi:hypothetical protein